MVEELRTQYRFENDGTGKREIYARVRVQSDAGVAQWGQVVVGYNSANERIEIPYVRVLKKDGSMVTASADSIQDLSAPVEREAPVYTDFRQKQVPVSGLRPGEVLEYDVVSIIHTAMAPGQFWAQHDFSEHGIVLDEQLDIDIPGGRTVKLKTKAGIDPKITEENGRRIYRWTHSHLESEDADDKKPKDKKKKKPKKNQDQPDVQMTTFPDWDAVGRWYAALERDRRVPTREIREKAAELTKDSATDLEKTEALYDYVAKNFRYVSLSLGLGRYQPHAAADVFHNQYGDCKDKNTLLAAMLEAEGIHSSSVLINSSRKLDPDVPSPMQFDHAITLVPLSKGQIWLDTTTEIAPFQMLSFNIRDKQALVIATNGTSRLENTPADTPTPRKEIEEIEGKVNELGKLEAHVHYLERGDTELVLRTIFRREPQPRWKQIVEMMTAFAGFEAEVSDLKVSDPAATREPFELSFRLEKANFIDWSSKKFDLSMPLSDFSLPDADDNDTSPDAEPIKLGAIGEHIYRLKFELPAKYTGRVPLPFSMARDYAGYDASYRLEGNVFTAERKMTVRQREVPMDKAPGYLAFRRSVLADMSQHLSLETTVAGTPALPKDLTADELNDAGSDALKSGNYPLAIDVFKRAIEVDPKHKFAWNNLGRAYLSLQRTDEAIPAFQKQIEVNPYDEYAYNNLGRAYRIQRKYEQAVAQFRKQLEVNPLDQFAHANLGGVYLDWKKYDEAAPELEKAIALTPEEPFAQVQLGDAYLNLGQDEKAIAAFDRALEISATPVMWNNVAYDLSLKKSHLDKAKQYAESAVASVSASLRNVRLDQFAPRELGLVPSLSAYWDTLGWVYFANNDLEHAERYVSAAWKLDPRSDVGDHLGEIYLKRGATEQAIRAYALSAASFRPDPETRSKLAALVHSEAHVASEIDKSRNELIAMRTFKLGNSNGLDGNADFFVLLEPAGPGVTVNSVKFISGDEKLKTAGDALVRGAKYNFAFPDSTPTKIFFRGTLSCSKVAGECAFVTLLPDDVRSVD